MLEDDVRVRSARAERADSCAEGKPRAIHILVFPLFQTLYDVERGIFKIDEFVQIGGMQGRNELTMLHLQKRLAYTDDPCRRFQMAYIAFDRTDSAGLILYIVRLESIVQTGDFNRVTKFGACAMRLDVPDASRPDIGFFKRRHNHIGLSFRIWNGVPAGPPAVVDNGALDHAIDIVAVQHSSIQRPQKERANAFSTYISIGALSKTAAYAVNRKRAASLIDIEFGLMEVQVYTAYEGGGTIAGMDRFTGQINGRQAGGTRRIQRQTC